MIEQERQLNEFEKVILASVPTELASKPNKNIKECCEYIKTQAKKHSMGGNCYFLSDEETYGLAKKYYEDDTIKVSGSTPAKVSVPKKPTKKEEPSLFSTEVEVNIKTKTKGEENEEKPAPVMEVIHCNDDEEDL